MAEVWRRVWWGRVVLGRVLLWRVLWRGGWEEVKRRRSWGSVSRIREVMSGVWRRAFVKILGGGKGSSAIAVEERAICSRWVSSSGMVPEGSVGTTGWVWMVYGFEDCPIDVLFLQVIRLFCSGWQSGADCMVGRKPLVV